MNRLAKLFIGLGSAFCLVLLGTGVFSQGYGDEFATAPAGVVYVPSTFNAFEASWLIGHRVMTPWEDAYLGQISGLIVDQTNGRVAAVVLSDVPNSGGSWLGNEHLILPYSSITDIGQDKAIFNPGNMMVGPSLEPNYVIGSDPWVYAFTIGGHPEFAYIPATMDVAWLTGVYHTYGQVPYWEAEGQQEPSSLVLIDSSKLMGARVQLTSGEAAGEVHDLVIDASDGRIAFVVLSDVPERPETFVAVPFSALSTQGNVYVLNATGDQLVSARSFDEFSDLNNPRWASSVYLFFGVAPYWTERTEITPSPSPEPLGNTNQSSVDWYQMYGY